MTPDPTPVVGTWNGEKPFELTPFAVIVTTEAWAAETTAVMSSPETVCLTVVAFWVGLGAVVAVVPPPRLAVMRAAVPPEARTAERRLTASRPASPRPPDRGDRGTGESAGAGW